MSRVHNQQQQKQQHAEEMRTKATSHAARCDPTDIVRLNNGVAAAIMNDENYTVITDPSTMNTNQWLDIFQMHAQKGSEAVPITFLIHDHRQTKSPFSTLTYALRLLMLSGSVFTLDVNIVNRTSWTAMLWIDMVRYMYLPDLAFYMTFENYKDLWDLGPFDGIQIMYDSYRSAVKKAQADYRTRKQQFDRIATFSEQRKN